jgi:hypothetical protein
MKARVFISKPDEGWSEIGIPEEFSRYSYDKLVSEVHKVLQHTVYKGLLITENPTPFLSPKFRMIPALSVRQVSPIISHVKVIQRTGCREEL